MHLYKRLLIIFKLFLKFKVLKYKGVVLNKRLQCESIYRLLDKWVINDNQRINVLFNTVDGYTNFLKKINNYILMEKTIPSGELDLVSSNVNSNVFFSQSVNGYYIRNPEECFVQFRKEVLTFCQLMENADSVEFGIHAYYGRVLEQIMKDLTGIGIKVVYKF